MATKLDEVIQIVDTELYADTVEWCPLQDMEHILLCGTYQLEESTPEYNVSQAAKQIRVGGIKVFSVDFPSDCQPGLKERSQLSSCGVLDIKWAENKVNEKPLFGAVDAEGFCRLHTLTDDLAVDVEAKCKLGESLLGLSLGFSRKDCSNTKQLIAVSDSSGCVTVLDVDSNLTTILSWHAHDYEAWITAFHKFDSNLIFSGGDDCRLKGWDVRDNSRPVFVSKRHQMGVCSVESHPFNEHLFASGSYDEEVIVWDRRNMKSPVTSACLGGGVWRIKWNPHDGAQILTATMYNGTHIVEYTNSDGSEMPIVAHHGGHNLAYGADWCRLDPQGKPLDGQSNSPQSYLVATCSFYDHALHLWEWSSHQNKR